MDIVNILLWAGIIAGGLMVLMLLLSMLSGFDVDADVDLDGDVDADAGGLGIIKSVLTFISVGSFTARAISLNAEWSWWAALVTGTIAGILSVMLLGWFLKFLLSQQEEGNYSFHEAEGKIAKVYIPILENGLGKITVEINGALRELPAKSADGSSIKSGTAVRVIETRNDFLIVSDLGL